MINKILPSLLFVALTSTNIWSVNRIVASQKPSVKGISTIILPNPSPAISPAIRTAPTPTTIVTNKNFPTPNHMPSLTKQYGGWYWNPVISKSQVWLGSDSSGNDIWADGLPTPTSIQKTNSPGTSTSNSGGAVSSGGRASTINQIETKTSIPKSSETSSGGTVSQSIFR